MYDDILEILDIIDCHEREAWYASPDGRIFVSLPLEQLPTVIPKRVSFMVRPSK